MNRHQVVVSRLSAYERLDCIAVSFLINYHIKKSIIAQIDFLNELKRILQKLLCSRNSTLFPQCLLGQALLTTRLKIWVIGKQWQIRRQSKQITIVNLNSKLSMMFERTMVFVVNFQRVKFHQRIHKCRYKVLMQINISIYIFIAGSAAVHKHRLLSTSSPFPPFNKKVLPSSHKFPPCCKNSSPPIRTHTFHLKIYTGINNTNVMMHLKF